MHSSHTLCSGIVQQKAPLRGRVTMNKVDGRLHLLHFDVCPSPQCDDYHGQNHGREGLFKGKCPLSGTNNQDNTQKRNA